MVKRVLLEKGEYEVFFDGKKKIDIAKIRFIPDRKFLPISKQLREHKPKDRVLIVTKINSINSFEGKFMAVKK